MPELILADLEQRAIQLLAALGDDAWKVACRLTEAGVTGRPGNAGCCPVAVHLQRELGDAVSRIAVSPNAICLVTGSGAMDGLVEFATPAPIQKFIYLYDGLTFPQLLAPAGGGDRA